MKTSVCIIDDDGLYKLLLKKSILKLPFEIAVNCYNNGQEALYGILDNKDNPELLPDVILLDINMPIMDGWEFLEAFIEVKWQLSKQITIFMASSSIANQDIEKSKLYKEVSDYLVKPINTQKLEEILKLKYKVTS
ncbi:response regulator [Paucihalobacter sp.]|uniref:response regulator n=1 Tax=Paucihalobacter sp. TaxID=2850405 RepID=UPI002FE27A37